MFFIPKLLCLCNFRLSDDIVSFDFSPDTLPGDFFRAVRSPEKGQKTACPLKKYPTRVRFSAPKVARIARNYYFCSLFGGPH